GIADLSGPGGDGTADIPRPGGDGTADAFSPGGGAGADAFSPGGGGGAGGARRTDHPVALGGDRSGCALGRAVRRCVGDEGTVGLLLRRGGRRADQSLA